LVQELEQAPPPLELSAEEMGLRYLMAVELSREGEWRAAMRHLELVAERRPDHWAIQILFAEAAYFLGEPLPRVRNALNLSLRQKPNNPRALSMLGQIAEDEGDLDEAETQYRAALASRGEELTPVLGLVRVLRRQGRAAEAVEILQNHIGEHGVTPRLLLTLASTQEHAGDLVGAQLSFERAATEHPDPLQGHLQLYQFFVRNKLTQEAAALAKTIERLRRLRDGERELRPLAPSSR
jgi:predicted Zn-dependent protease